MRIAPRLGAPDLDGLGRIQPRYALEQQLAVPTSTNARRPRDPSSTKAKRQSTTKPYEPFPFANMAPNSPSFSPLIPSAK